MMDREKQMPQKRQNGGAMGGMRERLHAGGNDRSYSFKGRRTADCLKQEPGL